MYAATAWRWIDPELRYELAARALRRTGFLAFWSAARVFPVGEDPFFTGLQAIYDEIGEGRLAYAQWPRPGQLLDHSAEIRSSGLFEPVFVCHYDREVVYDAEGYIELLNTFSGHIAMKSWQRERVFSAIRNRVSRRRPFMVSRHWGCVLHVAQRTE